MCRETQNEDPHYHQTKENRQNSGIQMAKKLHFDKIIFLQACFKSKQNIL